MTRSGSISSAPVLCGCAQADSCADNLWYWPAHSQPSRAYGHRTSLKKYTSTPATENYDKAGLSSQRGNANAGMGSGWDIATVGIPLLDTFSRQTNIMTMTVGRYTTHLTLTAYMGTSTMTRSGSQSLLTNVIMDGRRRPHRWHKSIMLYTKWSDTNIDSTSSHVKSQKISYSQIKLIISTSISSRKHQIITKQRQLENKQE